MATTPQTVYEPHAGTPSDLQEKARRHLWMHFTRMGAYDQQHEIPIIVRGEGSYVYDEHDKRYLDGLSALFCVNAGHGPNVSPRIHRKTALLVTFHCGFGRLGSAAFLARACGHDGAG